MTRKVSNPLALAVLACLYERPMHPYEMATTLRERHKDDSIKLNYGSLYAVVEALQKKHLISAGETSREGNRPERTVYVITDAGRLELFDWLAELISNPVKEFTQFEAGLSLLPVLPIDDAVAMLHERCRRIEFTLAQDQAISDHAAKQNFPRLFMIEAEYRTALRKAELDFVRGLIADITSGEFGGLDVWRDFHRALSGRAVEDSEVPARHG